MSDVKQNCPACRGAGVFVKTVMVDFGHGEQVEDRCNRCFGTGVIYAPLPASTAASEQANLLDELEDVVAGWGGDLVEKIEAIIKKHRAHPDCGACPGNGSVCSAECRLRADSPAAVSEQQASVSEAGWFEGAEDYDGNPLVTVRADELEAAIKFICIASLASHRIDGDMLSRDEFAKRLADRAALSGRATIPSEADERAGCRMQGGICACRSGGSFGGCARERAYCCTNEPARAATPDIATTAADQQGAAQAQAGDVARDADRWRMFINILVECGSASDAEHAAKLLDAVIAGDKVTRLTIDRAAMAAPATSTGSDA